MPQAHEDYSARRFHTDNFETELPDEVLRELEGAPPPKRPRILGRPRPANAAPRWPFYVLLLVAIMVIGGVIASWVNRKPAAPEPDRVLEHSRAILESATPVPTPYPSWQSYVAAHRAPRARLVNCPRHELSLSAFLSGE